MFIDIHCHSRLFPCFAPSFEKQTYTLPENLIEIYNKYQIDQGVLLPVVSSECAIMVQAIEEILEISKKWPDKFIPFMNLCGRMLNNSEYAPMLNMVMYYEDLGCKGVGEVMTNLPFNDPRMQNLLKAVDYCALPMTFHIGHSIGGCYGIYDEPSLPMLEEALQKYPNMIFLGHSQAFWSEIAPLDDLKHRHGYPTGSVTKPGRVVDLMRKYNHLHGDLCAKSGFGAISRDKEFGIEFLLEFQDRLYFGTDIVGPHTKLVLRDYLLELKEEGAISQHVFNKIAFENAKKLLKL